MKKRIIITLITLCLLLSTIVFAVTNPVIVNSNESNAIQVDTLRIKNDVKSLCTTNLHRNAHNLASLNEDASYIAD